MIGQLTGTVVSKHVPYLVIDCGGVGYEMEACVSVFEQIQANQPLTVYTHLSIREDAHVLFAFANFEERQAFRQLIKISGIGPKSALVILSSMSVAELAQTIANADIGKLVQVPGVGKKTAERLLIELKDKFSRLASQIPSVSRTGAGQSGKHDAVSALTALGYKETEAEKMVQTACAADDSLQQSEAIIRAALQNKLK